MSPVSNFHRNAQQVFYPSFSGGLNLSIPPESMERNELQEAINVEFSPLTGSMKVRGGLVWSARFDSDIDFVVPIQGRRGFLARAKGTRKLYYFRWNNIWPVSGELTGDGDISIAAWDEAFLIASGGKLQIFSDDELPKLDTLKNSPDNCRYVFLRDGRVGVVDGSDTLRFSAIGDCENWKNLEDDSSSSQYSEIGYKDGMDINAVVPLSKDLIIFKSPKDEPDHGTIWRLVGDFPDWAVYEVAHNTGTFSQRSVQVVGNDIFYLTVSGVATLSNVTAYGEVKTSWPDRKVSSALTSLITNEARLFNISVKQQLWILPSKDSNEIWVLDYQRGIWTKFQFPKNLVHATGVDNRLYVFIGRDLYEVNDGYTQDDIKDEGKQIITAYMKLGTILLSHQILVKGAYASFTILPECSAELCLRKFRMLFNSGKSSDYIFDPPNDRQYISEDDDPLFPVGGVLTARRRCVVRDWAITPEIKIYGGGCSISTMGLEIVEV